MKIDENKPEIKEFYMKRAKAFINHYGLIDKTTITKFLGITPVEYYRIKKKIKMEVSL